MSKVPWRALIVAAHPDDIEFGCAGTVATWTDAGAQVTYCIVTDGSTGTQDRGVIGEKLAETRRLESERAAKVVGVDRIEWLGEVQPLVLASEASLRRGPAVRQCRRDRPVLVAR